MTHGTPLNTVTLPPPGTDNLLATQATLLTGQGAETSMNRSGTSSVDILSTQSHQTVTNTLTWNMDAEFWRRRAASSPIVSASHAQRMRCGFRHLIQSGSLTVTPLVEAMRVPGLRHWAMSRAWMDRASMAPSVRMTFLMTSGSVASQKLPRALRDPGAMARKGLWPGGVKVPTSSAPVILRWRSVQTKTALLCRPAPIRLCA